MLSLNLPSSDGGYFHIYRQNTFLFWQMTEKRTKTAKMAQKKKTDDMHRSFIYHFNPYLTIA